MQHAPKAKRCFDAIQTGIIEGYDCDEGRVRPRVINKKNAKSSKIIGHRQTHSIRIVHDTVRFDRREIDGLEARDWRLG